MFKKSCCSAVVGIVVLIQLAATSASQTSQRSHPQPPASARPSPKPKPKPDRDITLGEFRKKYLGQRILILEGHDLRGSLGGWEPMKDAGNDSFTHDYDKGAFIPFSYTEQTPTVIAIKKSHAGEIKRGNEGQANIMGENVNEDDEVNPYVNVFVRFDDGQIAQYSNLPSLIIGRIADAVDTDEDRWDVPFITVAERDAHAAIMHENLEKTIGQKLYAIHDSLVFDLNITPEELLELGKRDDKVLRDIPLLVPMTIVGAKYNDRYDFIAWKLRLPDGREIISAARYRDDSTSKYGNDNSFLGRSVSTLLVKVPPALTAPEISAIRNRKIFRGMSKRAVFYSWGTAAQNNWGRGGYQLVYGDTQFVYLDSAGRVTDWQSIR
jgi:hypothetical protein